MKKTLLLVGTLLGMSGTGCGAPEDVSPESDASPIEFDTPDNQTVSAAALTTTGCTQLTARSVISNGHDGNVPANTMDSNLGTRWSRLGKGSWIDYDLGSIQKVAGVSVAWHQGNLRANDFFVSVSPDGYTYTQVYSGKSSGKTAAAETYSFPTINTRRVRVTFQGNSLNEWASIAEARACSSTSSTVPPTEPTPTPEPNPTPEQPQPGNGASVVWVGDFETNSRSQWSHTQMVSADRLALVSSPLRQGRYALKATVRKGDDPINSSGNRNELVRMTREPVNSEYYYRFSTMFDSSFPSAKTWQLFTQWHHEGNSGSPPVEFYVYGEEIRLNIGGNPGTIVWRTPLVRGRWLDFIFHVKWSPDSKVGFVELYLDGKVVLPKRFIATQYKGQLNYLKVGLYRNDTISPVGIVYHDGWTMARKLEDVISPTTVLKAP
ncbi:heparin lyase I family protein [Myxococcus sp. AM009]|uniref:heparin lyase I family protein n=1 Tax=unclassified Myxococcus TaxID=2648731 RepID=UPI0015962D22|nr:MULTISPECIES: heparin lyase I family protein [unclassified Myxococcus]NVJ01140.1 heparin lyase I family protein [Myxococcus sp. AM009]NVJ16470.1 heparin lyase I family protein [Myxococcus sp. AM010]